MSEKERVGAVVRRMIQGRFAVPLEQDLSDSAGLTGRGLFLDSIALVELLMACEDEFGVSIAEEFLNESSITVGSLTSGICGALAKK